MGPQLLSLRTQHSQSSECAPDERT
jgi:hypothetical protein